MTKTPPLRHGGKGPIPTEPATVVVTPNLGLLRPGPARPRGAC